MIDVFWWSKPRYEDTKLENFGDALVPYLLKKTTKENFRWVKPNRNKKFYIFKKRHYLMIGSIIRYSNAHSIVWGSGIINSKEKVKSSNFLTVRGPRTRNRLLELGYKVPESYGDPALLVALYNTQVKENIKYKIGVIPHYVDYEELGQKFANTKDLNLINVLTIDPQEVIDEILKCEVILSSSLHGIIVAHALRIPALWIRCSDRLAGDDIKFYDFYDSVGLDIKEKVKCSDINPDNCLHLFEKYSSYTLPNKSSVDRLIQNLIDTFPLKKTSGFKEAIRKFQKTI